MPSLSDSSAIMAHHLKNKGCDEPSLSDRRSSMTGSKISRNAFRKAIGNRTTTGTKAEREERETADEVALGHVNNWLAGLSGKFKWDEEQQKRIRKPKVEKIKRRLRGALLRKMLRMNKAKVMMIKTRIRTWIWTILDLSRKDWCIAKSSVG